MNLKAWLNNFINLFYPADEGYSWGELIRILVALMVLIFLAFLTASY